MMDAVLDPNEDLVDSQAIFFVIPHSSKLQGYIRDWEITADQIGKWVESV